MTVAESNLRQEQTQTRHMSQNAVFTHTFSGGVPAFCSVFGTDLLLTGSELRRFDDSDIMVLTSC